MEDGSYNLTKMTEPFEQKDFGEYQWLYELFCHFMQELHENGLDPSLKKDKKKVVWGVKARWE